MPSVLKHTECPACGHRHNFCFLGDDLKPGQDYSFLCPETSKQASLRPTVPPEIFRSPPQGAVVLEFTAVEIEQKPVASADGTGAISAEGDGTSRLQDVLPQITALAAKVGGFDELAKIVETLKQHKG